jgi:hypothetical protein
LQFLALALSCVRGYGCAPCARWRFVAAGASPRARVCIINHQSYFSLKQIILSKQVSHHFRTKQYQPAAKQIGCRSLLGFPGGLALCLSACSFGWWLMAGAGLF